MSLNKVQKSFESLVQFHISTAFHKILPPPLPSLMMSLNHFLNVHLLRLLVSFIYKLTLDVGRRDRGTVSLSSLVARDSVSS